MSPGFIDAHSHMDWVLPMTDRPELSNPFTEQGVTTFVAGNCGFGVAGFKKNSPHREMLTTRVHGMYDLYWHTMAEMRRIAQLVKKKDRIMTVHIKAYSSLSGTYPIKFFGRPHNLLAIEEMIQLARKSRGRARVLNHRYSNMDNIKMMMQHPASLFMTDATPALEGVQNPGSYGNFPLFLQYARDHRLLTLEDCVRKMTGASAERFAIADRGTLTPGKAADITVFDWKTIRDNNTREATDRRPAGIDHVFMNGNHVLKQGRVTGVSGAGQVL